MALGLLIVYVLMLLVRPQEWYEPVRGFELVNVSAILTIFAALINPSRDQRLVTTVWRNKYGRLMWGLLLGVVLSQLIYGRLHGAADAFSEFGKSCVLLFLTMTLVDNPKRLRRIMWVIVISAAIFCIHGIMQVKTGYGFADIEPFGSFFDGTFRVQGTGMFSDPNDFAMLYVVAIPFVFTFLQTETMVLGKFFVAVSLPAMLYVLYYTQSRGGVVGLGAMLLAYVWFSTRKTVLRILMAGAMLATVVVFGPARARETVYEGSAGGRIMQWGYGNQFLKQNPPFGLLFGIGYQRWLEYSDQVAHNSLVTCYGELGLFGYSFWFSLLWLVLRSVNRIARLEPLDRGTRRLAIGLFAALVGFYASAFFLTRTYNPFLYLMLGLGIGLTRYIDRQPYCPEGYLDITNRDIGQSVLMAVLSIPIIWVLIQLYRLGGGGS
jgi:putative inorganic carbon (HCO3(-)) transporter